jgi:hypothetical protein
MSVSCLLLCFSMWYYTSRTSCITVDPGGNVLFEHSFSGDSTVRAILQLVMPTRRQYISYVFFPYVFAICNRTHVFSASSDHNRSCSRKGALHLFQQPWTSSTTTLQHTTIHVFQLQQILCSLKLGTRTLVETTS